MNPQLQTMLQQAIQAFQSGNFDSADLILKRVLQADSKNLPALHILGLIKASQANHKEAADFLGRAARIHPNDASIQYNLAKALADSGNNKDAIAHHKKAVALAPNNPEAWLNYGKSASNLGRYEDALVWFGKALSLKPDYAEALLNKGAILKVLKKLEEAIALAEQALSINPNLVEAWSNKGGALKELKRFDEAVIHYDKAISLKPDYHEAWSNKGVTLHELKRFDEAIAHYDKALSLKSDYAEAWSNKGATLHELKRFDEAIAHYDKALSLKSDYAEAWSNKGATLHELKRYDEAIAHYDKAISLKPDYHETWSNKGVALYELNQFDEAITHYDKALSLKPDYHEAWANKGSTLNLLKKHSESAKCFQKALELNSKDSYLLGKAHHQMMLGCDWSNYEKNINEIFNLANEGRKGAEPFGFQGISSSEELLKKCAEIYSNDVFPPLGNLSKVSQYNHHKIRVGYLCGEFRNQATSILMTRVWELHNKSKFEIFAFDNGWDDDSDYRHRIAGAFSNIFDISRLSDLDAAKLIQHNEIDILVNLNGFFGYARQGIFSYKPAPIQVNYLGFPGTMGVKYMDYIIADKVVIPEESKIHYVEKLAYLPNSYQANDDMRTISDRKFSKAELGLPEDAFVFACFNNNYKITPTVFDSWLRILSLVQGSVLWLLADNPTAKDNLIKEAFSRGIDSSRLVFAERLPISEHLARHDLADLFLDTLPYNAHTTCSDALWVGLPVLTLMGHTFPGRVSASLLSAMGLSELVTHTQEEYEALAVELAMNRQKLADIKVKLAKNRLSTPLFNTPLFTKNIEAAYMKMMERYQADLEPDHIFVT
jgi:predicted O-linked N-acetylglucosamine transferase (SPINDLY family)